MTSTEERPETANAPAISGPRDPLVFALTLVEQFSALSPFLSREAETNYYDSDSLRRRETP
jgi:hypothetical protein